MNTVDRRARERLDVQEKILGAARELFIERGYRAVTMRQIADAIEYATDALAETVEGPVGGLLRDLNAFIRAEAEAKAKRTAEAA